MDPKAITAFVLVVVIIISIVILIFILKFLKIYVQAWASKANITMASLIGMWLRKVNTGTIVNTKIAAIKAGIMISTEELELRFALEEQSESKTSPSRQELDCLARGSDERPGNYPAGGGRIAPKLRSMHKAPAGLSGSWNTNK